MPLKSFISGQASFQFVVVASEKRMITVNLENMKEVRIILLRIILAYENYRLIAIVPALSKVLEKILDTRLSNWLNKNNIMHEE